ncbi:hypothetical protein KDA_29240 [Dictyobacter alpinus]|uniref:non-specific serine/threonine protein kinase n=1 Tax=Dictyobacter alpinus TaxID=2014873 RepID=A0A402B825_9CHLR|nr:serine/threonine-protein kinase [Dictyobacter alpinus]GCE27440.1 hypothetical protein KDA_29240 [Dictyobacter alpinus]
MEQLNVYCSQCGASNQKEAQQCFACGHLLSEQEDIPDLIPTVGSVVQQRYRLLKRVGSGGFSVVYQAEDLQTRKRIALKTVSLRGLNASEKIEATDAFNREVSTLTRLTHRNLPQLHEHFSDAECWYIVMDYVEGETLENYLERHSSGGIPVGEALDCALVLCNVLEYLHSHEPPIIFRDLKPSNVMITSQGQLFLVDFGIARQFKPGKQKDTIPFGSPGYASPEQYGKAQTTPRSDIYSLGAILHQLLTGNDPSQSPFSFAPLSNLQHPVQARLHALIQQMTALNSGQRPDSIKVVEGKLQEISRLHYQHPGIYAPSYYQPSFYKTINTTTSTQGVLPGYAVGTVQQQQQQIYHGSARPFQPQPQRNNAALLSVIFGILSICIPPFFCSSYIYTFRVHATFTFLIFALMLLPSVVGIILGHRGRRFAVQRGLSMGTATTGLLLSYIFTTIYLVFGLCFLSSMMFFSVY